MVGMVWYGMVWYVSYGILWYIMACYGILWYTIVWYGMVWYGVVGYIYPFPMTSPQSQPQTGWLLYKELHIAMHSEKAKISVVLKDDFCQFAMFYKLLYFDSVGMKLLHIKDVNIFPSLGLRACFFSIFISRDQIHQNLRCYDLSC